MRLNGFCDASPSSPCEHRIAGGRVCGVVSTTRKPLAMVCAFLPFAEPPAGRQHRKIAYHLCPTHRAEWERDGVPAYALAFPDREWRDEVREVLPVSAKPVVQSTAQQSSVERGLFG